ncbi:MFS general substrate transporter [Microthyrium microscopicum]|uniref:MFS general substrate transporter n=1 Tax=Microthyrium microscopicum TaxID=703497 RepID=A0A6A6UPW9_9PEZI|nr:MFS general substrate transporter [Microthyrium microscopicum]
MLQTARSGPQRVHYQPENEEEARLDKSINFKCDFFIVLVLAIDFLFQGIDKTNVGFAQASSTFLKDAHLGEDAVANALSLYSVTYVTLQPFSAMIGRRVGARNWISAMLGIWGVISMAHAATRKESTFQALRLLLGAAEAGFVPTSFYYLSTIYPKEYLGFRSGMFTGMYAVAGAFSGLVATGVLKLHSGAIRNWQILFLLEGGLTVLMAFVSLVSLPGRVETAWFLSPAERAHASRRINVDVGQDLDHVESTSLTKQDIVDAFRDWRKLAIVACNIFIVLPVTAFTTFLPVMTKGMGYKGVNASLMSVPPFVVGFVGLLIIMKLSDRTRERSLWLVVGVLIAIIGLIVMITSSDNKLRYGFTHVCLAGAFVGGPIVAAWLAGNSPSGGTRSVILGINGWSNLAGVISGQIFKAKYAPTYNYPLKVTLISLGAAVVGFLLIRLSYMQVNRKRRTETALWTEQEFAQEMESSERRGDRKRTFVYGY